MNANTPDPKLKEDNNRSTFEVMPDVTPRREGGDDAIAETNPTNSRMDEKVIVNEQKSGQVVNGSNSGTTEE